MRLLLALLTAGLVFAQPAKPERYTRNIADFLEQDKTTPPPANGILFIGSSIFRQWSNLSEQMAPLPVFNRAFGGSQTADILFYMDKIVLPYAPRMIVYYCGSNDINANISAETIAANYAQFVERVHARLPQTQIFFVSINRAPQKRDRWDVVNAANALFAKQPGSTFIDVNPALFNPAGEPVLELYKPDLLHFHPPAYDRFTAIIRPVLETAWKSR